MVQSCIPRRQTVVLWPIPDLVGDIVYPMCPAHSAVGKEALMAFSEGSFACSQLMQIVSCNSKAKPRDSGSFVKEQCLFKSNGS